MWNIKHHGIVGLIWILGFLGMFGKIGLIREIYAQEFKTDYQVEYFLNEEQGKINTSAKFIIKITNYTADKFVKRFTIGFPKTFQVRNIKATDNTGPVTPEISTEEDITKLTLEFNDPTVGKDTTNSFFLELEQDNLFNINGNVWEVILPTVENKDNTDYKVVVNLPPHIDKKISIAKPKPTFIRDNQIVWQNPMTRTIYAVFGDKQYYDTTLTYNLQNEKLVPVYTEVALPPDTLYQKTYITSLDPKPERVYTDEDGNYMAHYNLNPKETKIVTYKAIIELNTKYREEVKPYVVQSFKKQKNYLLTSQPFWEIRNIRQIDSVQTPHQIHNYVVGKLKYNYSKLEKGGKRMGADAVLASPDLGVCTEFTDLFVATAREKGVYAREIEGYGFANDPQLRPLSLVSDILHAWPEYYDPAQELWVPIDPTWENTSGIDYFTSFDLNHITFAIHGKKSDYPLPAGMYKIENSRDVQIKAVNTVPAADEKFELEPVDIPSQINAAGNYQTKLVIKNTGNTYMWNIPLSITADNLNVSLSDSTIYALAPYEKKEIIINLKPNSSNTHVKSNVSISMKGNVIVSDTVSVVPYYYDVGIKVAYVMLGGCILFIILNAAYKRRSR